MKDYVIIKLYRNEFSDTDYHDWMIDSYPLFVEELYEFLKERGKTLYFNCCCSNGLDEIPVSGNPMAEIEYTTKLSQEEKDKCVEILKKMSSDLEWEEVRKGNRKKFESNEHSTLTLVRLKKIDPNEELIEIDVENVDCSLIGLEQEE